MPLAETLAEQATNKKTRNISKVAVLGSGVMGSRIACHFANIGLDVLLLDIVPRELDAKESAKGLTLEHPAVRNRIVNTALKTALKTKPSPVYVKNAAKKITTGNFDDDFEKISECDWILEAVVERLDIKKIIFEKVDTFRKEGSLITSNTSGIPINLIQEGRSEDFRKNFCGTHFFNPPRYLRLLEIIPGPDTDQDVLDFLMEYGDKSLGKKTVLCKDTPAFIANRVGVYAMAKVFPLAKELDLNIEEIDKLSGPASGKPKTGTFRLSDLVGLDTTYHVMNGLKEHCEHDEEHAFFDAPEYVKMMVEKKMLGDKTRGGFYKKTKTAEGKRVILSLDLNTLEYREKQKVDLPSLKATKNISDLGKRLKTFFEAEDKGGHFIKKLSVALFAYASNRIPEIADHLYQIDDAIKAGFGWDKGIFETWEMVGIDYGLSFFEGENVKAAAWIQEMLDAGHTSFYRVQNGVRQYYDVGAKSYKDIPGAASFIILEHIKEEKTVWSNAECSLIDLGDGILNIEFHSKMNSLGEGVIKGIHHSLEYAEKNNYEGVVIANEGQNFSVGANLMFMMMMAAQQEWDELNVAIAHFQNTSMRLRTAPFPVVAAPHAMVLGGGCEFSMHSDKVVAAAETYIGLVEVGVGLIPGGGGTKEFAMRAAEKYKEPGVSGNTVLMDYLMNISTAKVAGSAYEAMEMDILQKKDTVVVNGERRIKTAKEEALNMAKAGYVAPKPRTDIPVLGRNTLGTFYAGVSGMQFGHYASPHDAKIAKKVAFVLCGGDLSGEDNLVSEQYLLDLEREAFLSLLGEKKTLERIQHMLQTGKPLRN